MNAMVASLMRTHCLMRASSQGLARHRARLWRRFQPTLAATPALKPHLGADLAEIPIVTPDIIRADYGRWNALGLTHQQLHAAAEANEAAGHGEMLNGVTCGYSTGTSGQRGLFIASAAERADYVGQSLARLLPLGALLRRQRIALVLRAGNNLYTDVDKAKRIAFAHFPLTLSDVALVSQMQAWQPTILIAPAHKLALFAKAQEAGRLHLSDMRHCFFGSEPMGNLERDWIGTAMGVRPDPIYQATEGFLAGACRFGRLHLNEHSLMISKRPIAGTMGWQPIVTDLRRTSQPIVNVCLDDFLEDDDRGPCPCGYAGRIILPVMGRVSDIWRFGELAITPRQISDAMESLIGAKMAWQAYGSPHLVTLHLDADLSDTDKAAIANGLAHRLALPCSVQVSGQPPNLPAPKRRRIFWEGGTANG
jgi:putative adenylate-forming enzyme